MTSKVLTAATALAALGAIALGVQAIGETGKLKNEMAGVKRELGTLKERVQRHDGELTPRVRPAEGLPSQ